MHTRPIALILLSLLLISCGDEVGSTASSSDKGDLLAATVLTPGQEGTFEIAQQDYQLFVVQVPAGEHDYSLRFQEPLMDSLTVDYVQVAWQALSDSAQDTLSELRQRLGSCEEQEDPFRQCTDYAETDPRHFMGHFSGPAKIAILVHLASAPYTDANLSYRLLVEETSPLAPETVGVVTIGTTEDRETYGEGYPLNDSYLEGSVTPADGEIITVNRLLSVAPIPTLGQVFTDNYAAVLGTVDSGTQLQVLDNCWVEPLTKSSYQVFCKVQLK